jgi:hypothetical protein
MVVRQINFAGRVSDVVVAEDQAPVSSNGQAPEAFQLALQWVQLPARKTPDLFEVLSCFQSEKKLAELVNVSQLKVPWRYRLRKAALALYAEIRLGASGPFATLVCTVIPYMSSSTCMSLVLIVGGPSRGLRAVVRFFNFCRSIKLCELRLRRNRTSSITPWRLRNCSHSSSWPMQNYAFVFIFEKGQFSGQAGNYSSRSVSD